MVTTTFSRDPKVRTWKTSPAQEALHPSWAPAAGLLRKWVVGLQHPCDFLWALSEKDGVARREGSKKGAAGTL
jgi:hypothetical protein